MAFLSFAVVLALVAVATANKEYVKLSLRSLNDDESGHVLLEVDPALAPLGAARFLELVHVDFFKGVRFFRNVPNFVTQVRCLSRSSRIFYFFFFFRFLCWSSLQRLSQGTHTHTSPSPSSPKYSCKSLVYNSLELAATRRCRPSGARQSCRTIRSSARTRRRR